MNPTSRTKDVRDFFSESYRNMNTIVLPKVIAHCQKIHHCFPNLDPRSGQAEPWPLKKRQRKNLEIVCIESRNFFAADNGSPIVGAFFAVGGHGEHGQSRHRSTHRII
jgi:hypothetical protein